VLGRTSKLLFSDAALGGFVTVLCLIAYLGDWPLLRSIEAWTYDVRVSLRANPKPSDQIVIVGVDEESLTRIGRWPWPRSVIGELLDILRESGAKVIGVGFVFSEPDQNQGLQEVRAIRRELSLQGQSAPEPKPGSKLRESDARSQDMLRMALDLLGEAEVRLDHDAKLEAVLQRTPQVVLPVLMEVGKPSGEAEDIPKPVLANALATPEPPLDTDALLQLETRKLIPPLPAFLPEGVALGHLTLTADRDGKVRQEQLVLEHRGRLYPSFALRILSAYLTVPTAEMTARPGSGVTVGTVRLPTDEALRMPISFNGPAGTFKAVPAHAVLTGQVLPDTFRGKLVLLGPVAPDITEHLATPTSRGMAGMEVVANVLQNALGKNLLATPSWAFPAELGMLVGFGAILMVVLPRLGTIATGIVTAVLLAGCLVGTTLAYAHHGYLVTALYPSLLLVFGFAALSARRFLATTKQQEMVVADGIESNKMLGLSFQGQGMLDMAFEKFKKCPLDESVMDLLYNLAMDFERKRMFNKSVAVYEHIATQNPDFKDIKERTARLKEAEMTMTFGSGLKRASSEATVIVSGGAARPTLGRYEIEKELGRGAMGTVFLGKDPKINRFVAIKTLHLDGADPEMIAAVKERFFREAESAGRLNHPNIVTIHDAGEEQELGYIAMEVLDGKDLKEWCRKDTLLPVKQVLGIVADVAEALDYAHSQDVVHRDIKPANIMMQKDGTVKVTDFGIARITTSSKTQTGVMLGTPSYMSPEQITSTKVDGRADIFSLGVVLFEMLTGEKPFQSDNAATLMFQIAKEPHPPILKVRPDLPAACEAIIDRALQKDAAQRYQRAMEMAQALRACAQGLT
jgi:eukaryotic-like serine/threonine-protein kinase